MTSLSRGVCSTAVLQLLPKFKVHDGNSKAGLRDQLMREFALAHHTWQLLVADRCLVGGKDLVSIYEQFVTLG